MINLCIVNSWILWRQQNEDHMPLYDFKLVIAEHLCKAGKVPLKKRGRPCSGSTPGTPTNIGSPAPGTSSDTFYHPKVGSVQQDTRIFL